MPAIIALIVIGIIVYLYYLLMRWLFVAVAPEFLVLGSLLATAAVLWAGARRLWSEPVAWLVCVGYLMCPGVVGLFAFTGMKWVTLWCTACVVAWLHDRPGWGGLAAGLALASGQHAAVVCTLVGVLFGCRGWRSLVGYAASLTGVVVVSYGACVALGGEDVFQALVGHHLYHVTGSDPGTERTFWFLYRVWWEDNLLVLVLFVASAGIACLSGGRTWGAVLAVVSVVVLHHLVVVAMAGGQYLYLHVVTPLIVLVAGGVFAYFDQRVEQVGARGRSVLALMLVLGVSWAGLSLAGWGLSAADFERRDREPYPSLPYVRWIEMAAIQDMAVAREIARDLARGGESDDKVFGYGTVASLVALESGRPMAGEYADLSPRWFDNGTLEQAEVIRQIERDGVRWFVTPKLYYLEDEEFRAYLDACYGEPEIWPRAEGRGRGVPRLFVFERSEDRGCLGD